MFRAGVNVFILTINPQHYLENINTSRTTNKSSGLEALEQDHFDVVQYFN